ncbi:YbbR-like domain-containing protein [Galbibacter sp. PAP.153]|uniref:YbbR-like domain-containing protein n=1 Tax=Galbibacter sp. PAP.153 TaxID=3104623 RepID=UPI003008CF9B
MAKKFYQYIKGVLRKPKASIFLMFLVVSIFIWFLISLSDTYISHVNFKLNYSGLPEDKLILGTPKKNLEVNIETSGFKILNYRIFKRDLYLPLSDFTQQKNKYYMLPQDIEEAIATQYKSIIVRRIAADSLILNLGVNKKKQVKVVANVELDFAEDHQLRDSLLVEPDSVWVRGPEDVVDKVKLIETEEKEYKNIQEDFEHELKLMVPDSVADLELETKQVNVLGKVERYTEKIVLVPVQVKNLPNKINLKLYPDKVKVLCKAPISELKKVNESTFKIICDYKNVSDSSTYLIPEISEKPGFISSATILDRKVEFLIKKQ